jgi:hypothetical protein
VPFWLMVWGLLRAASTTSLNRFFAASSDHVCATNSFS